MLLDILLGYFKKRILILFIKKIYFYQGLIKKKKDLYFVKKLMNLKKNSYIQFITEALIQ